MRFEVNIDPAALADLRAMRAYDRKAILDTIERVLTTAPTQVSRSRIKRLRGIDSPQYRLRVGEFRVFYDVVDMEVYVMRVLTKVATAEFSGSWVMKLKTVSVEQLATRTRQVVNEARKRPVVVRAPGKVPLILRPLVDDDAADELLVRSASFRASIRAARRRRASGKGITLAEARRRLKV